MRASLGCLGAGGLPHSIPETITTSGSAVRYVALLYQTPASPRAEHLSIIGPLGPESRGAGRSRGLTGPWAVDSLRRLPVPHQ
jgi:hypothetical protein